MRLTVKVIPKSSRDSIAGWVGDALKVCVTAAPERGKANAAVEAVLADALGLARGRVRTVAGLTSPRKILEIDGVAPAELHRRLATRARGR